MKKFGYLVSVTILFQSSQLIAMLDGMDTRPLEDSHGREESPIQTQRVVVEYKGKRVTIGINQFTPWGEFAQKVYDYLGVKPLGADREDMKRVRLAQEVVRHGPYNYYRSIAFEEPVMQVLQGANLNGPFILSPLDFRNEWEDPVDLGDYGIETGQPWSYIRKRLVYIADLEKRAMEVAEELEEYGLSKSTFCRLVQKVLDGQRIAIEEFGVTIPDDEETQEVMLLLLYGFKDKVEEVAFFLGIDNVSADLFCHMLGKHARRPYYLEQEEKRRTTEQKPKFHNERKGTSS